MQSLPQRTVLLVVLIALLFGSSAFFAYRSWQLSQEVTTLSRTLEAREGALATSTEEMRLLSEALTSLNEDRERLAEELEEERDRNDAFQEQIEEITGTVGKLDRLSQTDPELLKKYSKVYFLNEHYQPADLEKVDKEYVYDESRDYYLHGDVLPFFEDMLEDAADDGIELWVVSAFRSFDTQNDLKAQYQVTYGSGANTFSADQGYSEHQLGTTVDFTTTGLSGGLAGFQNTDAYEWLRDHAHEYGFVLSYPPNNQYYVFEPWHWRFVGTELAEDLHDADAYFYDWDQRRIDEYLIELFD